VNEKPYEKESGKKTSRDDRTGKKTTRKDPKLPSKLLDKGRETKATGSIQKGGGGRRKAGGKKVV